MQSCIPVGSGKGKKKRKKKQNSRIGDRGDKTRKPEKKPRMENHQIRTGAEASH
jgi:hypothetical protein